MTQQEKYWKERCEAAENFILDTQIIEVVKVNGDDGERRRLDKWNVLYHTEPPSPAQGVEEEADDVIRDIYNRHAAINGDTEPDPFGDLLKGTGKADKQVLSFVRELFTAGSRWQQGQQPAPTIGARWVRASERLPEEYEAVSWEYDDGTPLSLPAVRLAIKKGWQEKIFWLEKPPATFPTREQAEKWAKSDSKHVWFEEECLAALAMYDWIFNPQKDK